jgi:hypothetical protein
MRGLKTFGLVVAAGAFLLGMAPKARGNLNLSALSGDDPNAFASEIAITYATTGLSDANGTIYKFTAGKISPSLYNFSSYTVSPSDSISISSGSLSITAYLYATGTFAGQPLTSSELSAKSLEDTLSEIGTPTGGSPTDYYDSVNLIAMDETSGSTTSSTTFEMIFQQDASGLVQVYDPYWDGVLMTSAVSHVGFTSAFNNASGEFSAVADTFPVPEPSSMTLLVGTAGLFVRRRKRSINA